MIAISLIGALAGCGGQQVAAPPAGVGTQMDGPMPAQITHLRLIDSAGHPTSLAALQGKVIVVQDTMSLCQETCPLDTATLVDTARAVDAAGLTSKVVFLTVTVDPHRDTVAQLAAYRKLYVGEGGTPRNWLTLTGRQAQIDALWKFLGVYVKKTASDPGVHNWRTGALLTYDIQHSDEVFFFDPKGNERFILEGMPTANKSSIPGKVYRFLSKEGRDNVGPDKGDWTKSQALQVISWLTDHKISA